MKLYKILFSLLFLLTTSFNFASALDVCRGQEIKLNYTVSGVQSGQGCDDINPAPYFSSPGKPQITNGSANGFYPVTIPSGAPYGVTQNFSLTCGVPPLSGTGVDTLNVLTNQVWNGSVCVPITWTSYCPASNDPNGNVNRMWQYSNANPVGYRDANTPCCSATGALSACAVVTPPPTPSVTWTSYCTPVGDANPNRVWEYSNATPPGYNDLNTACCSANGASSRSACSVVTPPAGAPTITASFSPSSITSGQLSTVSWSSTNATAVSAVCTGGLSESFSGLNPSGSSGRTLTANTTCTFTATGTGGSATAAASLNVTAVNTTKCNVATDSMFGAAVCSGNCANGYTNYPTCAAAATCPAGQTGTPPNCTTPPPGDRCGSAAASSGAGPTRIEPTGPSTCTSGAYSPFTVSGGGPYTGTSYWFWNCGSLTCVVDRDNTPPPPPPTCGNGLLKSAYPSCACPVNPEHVIIGQYCYPVGQANLSVVWSGLANPNVTPSCPSPLTQTSLTRNGTSVGAGADTGVVSGVNSQSYTYNLTCSVSGIIRTATQSITIPPKVKITNLEDVVSPIGDNVNLRWNSTGNECSVYDFASVLISPPAIATRTGTSPNYAYTYTIAPNSPQFRTELNSRRIGSEKLSYVIKCKDTAEPIRGIAEDKSLVEVFKKPVASITGPNASNQLTFSCTPDYNKVDIKVDGVSFAGYPKNYIVTPNNNFSTTLNYDASKSYTLTCSYNTFSDQASKSNDLQIFGEINGVSGIADSTATASSSDGLVNNMTYTISNFDSWSIEVRANAGGTGAPTLSGTSASPAGLTSRYAPNVLGEVTIVNNPTVYINGLNIKIVAKKESITKTLTLKLIKVADIFADIKVVSAATSINPDLVNLDITCKNATSYELYKNGVKMSGYPIPINEEIFNTRVSDTASATGDEATYRVKCMAGSQFKEASAEINIPSKTPVNITNLLIQPNQIACPGGNDSASLKFILGNTTGKTCKITATAINENPNKPDKVIQMTALNSPLQLTSGNYKSSNSIGFKSLEDLVKDKNGSNVSGGQIVLSSVNKLSNGKRLFNYSTRFTMECGSLAEPLATRYLKTNATYSSKSVDMLSICVGQD